MFHVTHFSLWFYQTDNLLLLFSAEYSNLFMVDFRSREFFWTMVWVKLWRVGIRGIVFGIFYFYFYFLIFLIFNFNFNFLNITYYLYSRFFSSNIKLVRFWSRFISCISLFLWRNVSMFSNQPTSRLITWLIWSKAKSRWTSVAIEKGVCPSLLMGTKGWMLRKFCFLLGQCQWIYKWNTIFIVTFFQTFPQENSIDGCWYILHSYQAHWFQLAYVIHLSKLSFSSMSFNIIVVLGFCYYIYSFLHLCW